MKRIILAIFLMLSFCCTNAQQKSGNAEKKYAKKPLWITMMDDTKINFFEIEKAYNVYWQHHEKPEGEDYEIGAYREREKTPSKRKQRRISEENDIRMAVKKYEVWHEQTLPYVQPDGRILSAEERLSIWRNQQNKN
jgi:hypothetical protein